MNGFTVLPEFEQDTPKPFGITLPMPSIRPEHIRAILTRTQVDRAGCWNWTGSKYRTTGYGRYELDGTVYKVHRLMCHFFNGDLPQHLVVDHLCRNTSCVNPSHLEAVTPGENTRRGNSPAKRSTQQTHCKRGHEYTPENTLMQGGGKSRACRTCHADRERTRRNRNVL